MADQTSSSIVIDAPPSRSWPSSPTSRATPSGPRGCAPPRCARRFPDGRAEEVFFEIEASPIKDAYTLVYDWQGEQQVAWTLGSGKMMKRLDGSYVLAPTGRRAPRSPTGWPSSSASR